MNKTNNLHRAVDDAKDQVVGAFENAKAQASATADQLSRTTRKTIEDAQGVTEEAWSEASSTAKNLRSRVAVYLHEQPANGILVAVAAGFLVILVLLFLRLSHK